ncbi:MAG TPA: hypothetical protein VII94_03120 [Candidatus Saccharimonadales bacterium]
MASEYNVMIWSVTEQKWISTYLYFPSESPGEVINETIINEYGSTVESTNFEPTSGYQELLPVDSIFPTNETWYTDNTKTKKIIEKDFTWQGVVPTVIIYKLYATDGITITQTIQDTITYSSIFEQSITRTIL